MFSVVSNVYIFSCLVLFIRKAELAPTFTATPQDPFDVVEGNNITLVWQYNLDGSFGDVFVQFLGSSATLTIVDKHDINDDAAVPESVYQGRIQAYINATRAEITIFELNRSESGEYEIQAVNSKRQRVTNRVTVQVQYPPELNRFSGDVAVVEGDPNVTLECIADGEPSPSITWTRVYANDSDSGVLGAGDQFVLENNRNNSGTYRCTAYNGIGTAPNRTVKVEVNYKPENVKLVVNNSVVCEGDVIGVTCSADGKPAVHTYQLLENEILVNDGNSSAGLWTRKDLKGGDLSYSCVANNTAGTTKKSLNGTVKVPSKVYPSQNITVIEGENKTLICNVSGSPVLTVTWTEVSSRSQSNGIIRYLKNISRNNAGEYKCEATNDCGNSSASIFLTVLYKPEKFKFTVSKPTMCQGSVITFNCTADGKPAVDTYQLLENGVPVGFGSNSRGIWSRNMSTGGEFNYTCIANNAAGTAYSMSLTVTVNASSSIQAIQDQNVNEGHNLTLTCNVSGMLPVMVSWIKPNGQSVAGKVLELVKINRSEAGEYTCEASNECGNVTEMASIDVQSKPENVELTISAVNSKACKGDVVKFNCSADANPAVSSYQLFENDTAILNASASGMWSKTLENEGFFVHKCVANNSLGSDYSMRVTVTVNVPSEIEALQYQNVTEDENLTLTCTASGMPQPKLSWINPNGQRVAGRVLQFVNINRSEAGEYRCEASNECGNATEMATIDVQYKPGNVSLTTSVIDDKACQGNTITFNCSADAKPTVTTYQLFKNDTAMNVSLSGIWNETLARGGVFIYKCVANNTVGTASSTDVTVTVNVPSNIEAIQGQNETEGNNLTLTCTANGMPQPKVYWIKPNGQSVAGKVLEIVNINRNEDGKYKCEASNECGNATEMATIDVQYEPENAQLTTSVIDDKECQGNTITFNCSADAKPAVTTYRLFKNDTVMDVSLSGMWNETLASGGVFVYKCVANNTLGMASSMNVTVTVNVPSSIQAIDDKTVTEGDNLTLMCNVSGVPPPMVSWMTPNVQRHNGYMLNVVNINRSQAGGYKCEASNECDNETEIATIDVRYASRITKISGEHVVNKGDEVSLICLAEGNPAPRITWTKVADDSRVNFPLTIRGSQDEGMYRCTAENGVGSLVTKFVNMTVRFPAAIESMGNHTAVKGGTIILYCNVSGTPPPTVLWMHVKSGETWNQKKWTIEGIQVEKLGEYRCDASNKYGRDIKNTFISYEGGFCEKSCTAGKLCRKFGATYFCICPPGKTGTNCQETEKPQKNFVVGLKLKGEFKQVYEDLENLETKTLVRDIEKNIMDEFKGTGLANVKFLKLRQGSIIADLELTFNDRVGQSDVKALLTQAEKNGKIGDMKVEAVSVGETFPEPTSTSEPPNDCGTFFEGEDCKKAKPGLIVLCVIGGVVVVAIIVAMIAYGLHKKKKKSRVGSLSNANKKDEATSGLAD